MEYLKAVKVPSPAEIEEENVWIRREVERIGPEKLDIIGRAAMAARNNAYDPYSKYAVGAAILCRSGKIFSGCNTEVVTYTQTGHAENNAINTAINAGEAQENRRFIEALVVCHSTESQPCGSCRQVMAEHCDKALVIEIDLEGNPLNVTSLKILFPYAFTPSNLGK